MLRVWPSFWQQAEYVLGGGATDLMFLALGFKPYGVGVAGSYNRRVVKIWLRDRRTKLYYAGPNQWTSRGVGALDFGSVEHATVAARQVRIADMEIVLNFETVSTEVPVPLRQPLPPPAAGPLS
ncbi:MAG TPA: hypothetical protein VNZ22_12660 [Bacillota bacterium]|nr:hypothetical protein [Bacillota bacterium]